MLQGANFQLNQLLTRLDALTACGNKHTGGVRTGVATFTPVCVSSYLELTSRSIFVIDVKQVFGATIYQLLHGGNQRKCTREKQ